MKTTEIKLAAPLICFFRRVEAECEALKQEVAHIKWQEDGSGFGNEIQHG